VGRTELARRAHPEQTDDVEDLDADQIDQAQFLLQRCAGAFDITFGRLESSSGPSQLIRNHRVLMLSLELASAGECRPFAPDIFSPGGHFAVQKNSSAGPPRGAEGA
jgi:hypothetical protein